MDPGLVSEAIRGLFEAAGVKRKSVVTAVGGRDVIVKKIQMDRMKEGDAREVIRWEAEQHVPFDMANVELDFQIDRKSTRLNSSHGYISYAVFCLKKKNKKTTDCQERT